MKKIITFDKSLEFPSMIGEITSITLDQELQFKNPSSIDGKLFIKGTYKRTEASRLEEDFYFELPTEILLTEKLDLSSSKIDIDDFYYKIESDDTINCHIDILVEGIEIVDLDEEENTSLKEHKKKIDRITSDDGDGFSFQDDELLRECDGDVSYEKLEVETLEDNKEKKMDIEEKNDDDIQILELEENKNIEEIDISSENNILNEKEENIKMKTISDEKQKEQNIVVDGENVGSLFTSLKDSEETFSTYAVYIVRQEETLENIMDKYNITKEELESYNDISSISIGSKVIIPLKNE